MSGVPGPSSGGQALLESALATTGLVTLEQFHTWLAGRRQACRYAVEVTPLSELREWRFEQDTGNLVHRSGKFFRVEGLDVRTNFGPTPHWTQPIINQPEVGVLGFLTKRFDGLLHFLVQAKMEPGNVGGIQLSPTVQATRSNYTQVHGGLRPPYIDWFHRTNGARVLFDQLQSEQGARFFRKRNRNIIVEVGEKEEVEPGEDFLWLTLGQLLRLLRVDNLVNMDSRSVLACIPFSHARSIAVLSGGAESAFGAECMRSALADDRAGTNSLDAIMAWFNGLKAAYTLDARLVPLRAVDDYVCDGKTIRHRSGKFFSVIGVSVEASSREVKSWQQPLIQSAKGGLLCFLCQQRRGVLHFLLQGRVEPGNLDRVELSPTLQCTPSNYDFARAEAVPPFYEYVVAARPDQVRYSAYQSEEGGRFYQDENHCLILEVDPDEDLKPPPNFTWMTIHQMREVVRFSNYLNVETRGLSSCLGPADCPPHAGAGFGR